MFVRFFLTKQSKLVVDRVELNLLLSWIAQIYKDVPRSNRR